MAAKRTPREVAAAEVEAQRGVVAKWESEVAAATVELDSLQERAGEEVLADESAAGRLSKSMQELRDRIDIASRAVAAAMPRLHAAARAVVLAEADEWDAERARRQVLLDEFDAQQRVLLKALQDFTGFEWQINRHEHATTSVTAVGDGALPVVTEDRRGPLLRAVQMAERTVWCLREIADGRDPHKALNEPFEGPRFVGLVTGPDPQLFYTDSVWGPGAVLPAPEYRRRSEVATTGQMPAELAG